MSSPTGPALPTALRASFFALIERLLAAQSQLVNSYARVMSSAASRSRPATPTGTADHLRVADDHEMSARAHSDQVPTVPTHSIRARAYEFYERRGHQPGGALEDWLRAEAEVRAAAVD